jgi:hypothetical protein
MTQLNNIAKQLKRVFISKSPTLYSGNPRAPPNGRPLLGKFKGEVDRNGTAPPTPSPPPGKGNGEVDRKGTAPPTPRPPPGNGKGEVDRKGKVSPNQSSINLRD